MRTQLQRRFRQTILQRCSIVLLAGTVISANAATSSGQVTQATDLKIQPTMQAAAVAALKAQQQVDISTRQGGWYQVKTVDSASQQGWLPLFFVRFTHQKPNADPSLAAPTADRVFKNQQQVTTTTGVRGLNRGDIEASTGDFLALANVQKLKVKADAVQEFVSVAEITANPDIAVEQQP